MSGINGVSGFEAYVSLSDLVRRRLEGEALEREARQPANPPQPPPVAPQRPEPVDGEGCTIDVYA